MIEISRLQLKEVSDRLEENDITLKISDDVVFYFAENGYDVDFGARPLKRLIEEKLVDEIAMRIVENRIKPGDTINPKIESGKIVI